MMKLWVYYMMMMDGERIYLLNILSICHASTLSNRAKRGTA